MRFLSVMCCVAAFGAGRVVAQGTSREPGRHAQAAHWMPRTTDWTRGPNPIIGDWGFDRPGYAPGLYVHGITVKAGEKVTNPVIYDNDLFDDVFDDEWAMVMASLGEMNLVALIVTPVLTDGWGFSHPDRIKTGSDARDRAQASGMRMDRIPPITVGTEYSSNVSRWSANSLRGTAKSSRLSRSTPPSWNWRR